MRFENVIGRWVLIPRSGRWLRDFQIYDEQWGALALPIGLAFLFYSTPAHKAVAMYPSPAGAIESLLPLASWSEICQANPAVAGMKADVEALLINRLGDARAYFIAPIDACYELAGIVRAHWRGLTGSEKVRDEIGAFFERVRQEWTPRRAEEASALMEGVYA